VGSCEHWSHKRRGISWPAKWLLASLEGLCSMELVMEQSPSSEANSHSATQNISRLLWNPNFHYHVHKIPPPEPDAVIFHCPAHSKESVQVRGPVYNFVTCWFFTVTSCEPPAQPPIWRTTPCWSSETAHSIYPYLEAVSSIRNPRTLTCRGDKRPAWRGPSAHIFTYFLCFSVSRRLFHSVFTPVSKAQKS
jgi:hypothetical protein